MLTLALVRLCKPVRLWIVGLSLFFCCILSGKLSFRHFFFWLFFPCFFDIVGVFFWFKMGGCGIKLLAPVDRGLRTRHIVHLIRSWGIKYDMYILDSSNVIRLMLTSFKMSITCSCLNRFGGIFFEHPLGIYYNSVKMCGLPQFIFI